MGTWDNVSSEKTLENYIDLLCLQDDDKTLLVYHGTQFIGPDKMWRFWSMPIGKVGRGEWERA